MSDSDYNPRSPSYNPRSPSYSPFAPCSPTYNPSSPRNPCSTGYPSSPKKMSHNPNSPRYSPGNPCSPSALRYPSSPNSSLSSFVQPEYHLLNWEEHSVDYGCDPDLTHMSVTEMRQGNSGYETKERVHDYVQSLLSIQAEQRNLAKMISERHNAARINALRGNKLSVFDNKHVASGTLQAVNLMGAVIESVFSASEAQQRVLKLSNMMHPLNKKVEALEAIIYSLEEEKKLLESNVMKAEGFEITLRRELKCKEDKLQELYEENFKDHKFHVERVLNEDSHFREILENFRESDEYKDMLCSFYNKGVETAIDAITEKHPSLDSSFKERKSLEMTARRIKLQPWFSKLEADKVVGASALEDTLENGEEQLTTTGAEDLQQQTRKRTPNIPEEEHSTKKGRTEQGVGAALEIPTNNPFAAKLSPTNLLAEVDKIWQKCNASVKGWSDKYLAHSLTSYGLKNGEKTSEHLERIQEMLGKIDTLCKRVKNLQATISSIGEEKNGLNIRLNKAKEFIADLQLNLLQAEEDEKKICDDTKKIADERNEYDIAHTERLLKFFNQLKFNLATSIEYKKIADFLHNKGFEATIDAVAEKHPKWDLSFITRNAEGTNTAEIEAYSD